MKGFYRDFWGLRFRELRGLGFNCRPSIVVRRACNSKWIEVYIIWGT